MSPIHCTDTRLLYQIRYQRTQAMNQLCRKYSLDYDIDHRGFFLFLGKYRMSFAKTYAMLLAVVMTYLGQTDAFCCNVCHSKNPKMVKMHKELEYKDCFNCHGIGQKRSLEDQRKLMVSDQRCIRYHKKWFFSVPFLHYTPAVRFFERDWSWSIRCTNANQTPVFFTPPRADSLFQAWPHYHTTFPDSIQGAPFPRFSRGNGNFSRPVLLFFLWHFYRYYFGRRSASVRGILIFFAISTTSLLNYCHCYQIQCLQTVAA